jgi:hypothetical protein
VATFFEALLLVSSHQKFTAIHSDASFLLSASLISCIPYLSVHKLFLLLGMKALKFHMLHMFAFDESHDIVMIPISLSLTNCRRSRSCSRRTSTSTINNCYWWIVLYRLHWIILDLIATLSVFVRWICVMLKDEHS